MDANERGDVRVAFLRSSDYSGPGVVGSFVGERLFGSLVAGKKAQVFGSLEQPHSLAYIEDVGRAAAALGVREDASGRVWFAPHGPAPTQGEVVEGASRLLGIPASATVMSPTVMRIAGLFDPGAKESAEMMYEFTAPFVVDSSRSERDLGLRPTPLETGLERTVGWYRKRAAS
jgi:nucleoside-diphosphate-sugar epimerase